MSKIGKKNILVPKESSVIIEGSNLTIKGPKGSKSLSVNDKIFSSKLKENEFIFHAGTKIVDGKIYSNGGRVLNFIKISENFKNSRDSIIKKINDLNWSNGFFRKDIGYKVIDE